MLTTVRAYSARESADTLLLADNGRAETDLLQVRDITGLEPVEAAINTIPFGFLDGDSYAGSSVSKRNIVLTIKPNPNWIDWTYEKLRRILYAYFMPKSQVRLVFETDEIPPVEITGYVESIDPAIFSKDGEIQISIICPYPHFMAVTPIVVTGFTNGDPLEFDYDGSVETAVNLEVLWDSGVPLGSTDIQIDQSAFSSFIVSAPVNATTYFIMNSVPGNKYVRTVDSLSGEWTNILANIQEGSIWPILKPGPNYFNVATESDVYTWKLTYYKRYGGL